MDPVSAHLSAHERGSQAILGFLGTTEVRRWGARAAGENAQRPRVSIAQPACRLPTVSTSSRGNLRSNKCVGGKGRVWLSSERFSILAGADSRFILWLYIISMYVSIKRRRKEK